MRILVALDWSEKDAAVVAVAAALARVSNVN